MTGTMKAIVLGKFGGFDAFEMRDVAVPQVGARQVRVRVHATAINPLDYRIRRGDYADHGPLPAFIGHDVSGVMEESSTHEFVRSLGADEAIDYVSDDYVSAVADLTHGRGLNVVFDTIGGDALTRSALALADAGRVVSIIDIAQPQNLIEARGRNAAYHFVFTRQNRGKLDALTTLVERGRVRPVVGAVLPLGRIGEAHELVEGGSARGLRGKLAIDVTGQTVELPASR